MMVKVASLSVGSAQMQYDLPARYGLINGIWSKKPVNGMVRRRSLEVVECGDKEASHETTRGRN
jgi:hypothetical protein